jgi:hypothetical protein
VCGCLWDCPWKIVWLAAINKHDPLACCHTKAKKKRTVTNQLIQTQTHQVKELWFDEHINIERVIRSRPDNDAILHV